MAVDIQKLITSLRTKREAENLSIRALGKKIGVSFSTLARIERGEGEPDNNSIIRILHWLGPEPGDAGLSFDNVALVHFRAQKNVSSKTVRLLLHAANSVKQDRHLRSQSSNLKTQPRGDEIESVRPLRLSKSDMEEIAKAFRKSLNLEASAPLDALKVRIRGVESIGIDAIDCLDEQDRNYLIGAASSEWSAMSIPIDIDEEEWVILRNRAHPEVRQRVTYLEECWHIMLGHRLTKIAKISDAYGRTFEDTEEDEAYYLAAASLLPQDSVKNAVKKKIPAAELAEKYGVSEQLVEYRIKRLGLWADYKGRTVSLG